MGASVGFRFRTQWAFPAQVGAPPLSPIEFAQAQSPGKNPAEGALRDLLFSPGRVMCSLFGCFFPPWVLVLTAVLDQTAVRVRELAEPSLLVRQGPGP